MRGAVRSGQGWRASQREGQSGRPAQRGPHVRQGAFGDENPVRPGAAALAAAAQGRARCGTVGAHHLGRGPRLAAGTRGSAHGRVRCRDYRLRPGHGSRHQPVDGPCGQRRRPRAPQPVAGKHLPGAHDGAGVSAVRHVPHFRRVRFRSRRLHRVLGRELRVDRAHLHLGPGGAQPRPRGEAHRDRPVLRASAGGQGRPFRGAASGVGPVSGHGVAERHHERGSIRSRVHAEVHQRAHAAHRGGQRAAERGAGGRGRQPPEHACVRQELGHVRGHSHPRHRRGHGLPCRGEAGRRHRGASDHRVAGLEGARGRMDARARQRDVLGPGRGHSRVGPHLRRGAGGHHQRVPGHRGADQLQGHPATGEHHHCHLR